MIPTMATAKHVPKGEHVTGPVLNVGAAPVLLTAKQAEAIALEYGQPIADLLLANVRAMQADHYAKIGAVIQQALEATAPDEPPKQPLLMSHPEAAAALGISESTVKRLVQEGRLPKPVKISAHRIGHRWADIKAFADGQSLSDGVGKGEKFNR